MAKPTPSPTQETTNEGTQEAVRAGLEDLIQTWIASPDKFQPMLYVAEMKPNGNPGASLAGIEADPIETLERRMIAAWGVPLAVIIRLRLRGQPGFGPVFYHEMSERSSMRTQPPPASATQVSSDAAVIDSLRAELERLRARMENPAAVSSVPTDPFSGAQRLFELTKSAARDMAPTPQAAPDMTAIVELARQAAEKTDGKMALFEKALPYLGGGLDRILAIVEKSFDVRKEELRAMRQMREPEPAFTPEIISEPVSGEPFGTQQGTSGEPAEPVRTPQPAYDPGHNPPEDIIDAETEPTQKRKKA